MLSEHATNHATHPEEGGAPAPRATGPRPDLSGRVGCRGARLQIGLGLIFFLLSTWLTFAAVTYVGGRNLLSHKTDYIETLKAAYADLLSESQVSTAAFVDQIADLEAAADRQQDAIDELTGLQEQLRQQLEAHERQLSSAIEQRERMEARLAGLQQRSARDQARIADLTDERAVLSGQLAQVESRLAEVTHQRDAGRRAERGLRWQVARLESQLEDLEADQESAKLWFRDWVLSSVDSLEQLFIGTGVDLEVLVARAAGDESGQGGPLQGIDPEASDEAAQDPALEALTETIRRLSALQKLASSLPLASPLDHFHVTSYYGKRRDPLTRGLAFHSGLDLGAATGSAVLATAPGTVVAAGPAGPYGNMVEIDHGMGVTTRYGHLSAVDVRAGAEVGFRQPIGVIGNTGRSTGRHLHYEVRIDDRPLNPAKFVEAGRYLVDIFNLEPSASGGPEEG